MSAVVKQLIPEKKELDLERLYLSHRLQDLANKLEGPLVISNYITDKTGVIAKRDEKGRFQVPSEIRNPHDWRLFQELEAQSDVIITASNYLKRFIREGDDAQNVFSQFERGNKFEHLGDWRIKNGFDKRHPDVAIVSRSLNFEIPNKLLTDRKISIFTTFKGYESEKGLSLQKDGAHVVAAGKEGVDGRVLINHLANELNYNVIHMVTGPAILRILLESNQLDRLYITQVQREISSEKETTKLLEGKDISSLPGFKLVQKFTEEKVRTDDGKLTSQHFLVFDSIKIQNIAQ